MSDYIFNSNCWADHAIIRSFFKAFDTRCSLVIFDDNFGGLVYFQKEWTKDKDMYICLQRERNHYRPMKLNRDGEELPMCLPREIIVDLIDFVKKTHVVHNEF